MKWMIVIILVLVSKAILIAQGVGIGTTTPLTKLHIQGGGFLIDGSTGVAPVSGPGRRLMWIPSKGAFRAGEVNGNEWNQDSIGFSSVAMGTDCIAKGFAAFAFGQSTRATGYGSIAMGIGSIASGYNSTVFGGYNTAKGNGSIAWGEGTLANHYTSTSWGNLSEALGPVSTAFGLSAKAIGMISASSGWNTMAKSFAGTAIGMYNDSTDAANMLSPNPNNRLFEIGNGTANTQRCNAMTVLQNGNTGLGTTTPLTKLHIQDGGLLIEGYTGDTPVSGEGRRLMWIPSKGAFRAGETINNQWDPDSIGDNSVAMGIFCIAKGFASFAIGENTRATGFESLAMGHETIANGNTSTAFGSKTKASGTISTAFGSETRATGLYSTAWGRFAKASGFNSTAWGVDCIASGSGSTAFGHSSKAKAQESTASGWNTITKSFAGTVIGTYNDTSATILPPFDPNSRLFEIGNGTDYNQLNNAMTVLQNGNVGIGTTTPINLLEVAGRMRVRYGASNTAGIFFNKSDNSSEAGFVGMYADDYIGLYGAGVGWAFLMNTLTGNVGIGAAAPTEKLNVIGNGLFTGTVTASCGVLVCSDIRYKKNILPVTNALINLQFLHGIYYHWDKDKFSDKAFTDERQIGFSAQELEKVYPEMVHTDVNGYKTVDYSRLTPVLVEAIKEQQLQIDQLREQVEWLMQEIKNDASTPLSNRK